MSTSVKTKERRVSSASQKFWPLKKFGLHNNSSGNNNNNTKTTTTTATAQTTQSPPTASPPPKNVEENNIIDSDTTFVLENDAQKKSKNKRLSSLLSSSRRQEDSIEAPATDTTKKQQSNYNVSNTPTITKKAGREIKAKAMSQTPSGNSNKEQKNNMTAKSAGSGALSRSNTVGANLAPSAAPINRAHSLLRSKESRNNIRRSSEDRVSKNGTTRPHSPPIKRNDSPTHRQQPNVMLESVQQQIQKDQKRDLIEKEKRDLDDDNDSAIEEDNNTDDAEEEEINNREHSSNRPTLPCFPQVDIGTTNITSEYTGLPMNYKDEILLPELKHQPKGTETNSFSDNTEDFDDDDEDLDCQNSNQKHTQLPLVPSLPSPPVTPAVTAVYLLDTGYTRDDGVASTNVPNSAANMANDYSEFISPTLCTSDIKPIQNINTNKLFSGDFDKQQLLNNAQFNQQQQHSIQRIHRLRPAASFATLRQLASTNNNSNISNVPYSQHQQQYQFHQQLQQQQLLRTPASSIESANIMNGSFYSNDSSSVSSEDYLTAKRPAYYRRASSEDTSCHYHARHQSDNTVMRYASNNIQSIGAYAHNSNTANNIGNRRLVRSNTVHNLIIKDGQGHRIVQCVGLEKSPSLQPQSSRRQTPTFESNDLFQTRQDWSPPSETIDDPSAYYLRQQVEELQYQQQQLLILQNQQQNNSFMNSNNASVITPQIQMQQSAQDPLNDNSSSDSGSHGGGGVVRHGVHTRRIKRKNSAKSLNSLSSNSPPMTSYDTQHEQLKVKLEKERAIVKALQKQKEACNKDVVFLSKNLDDLTTANTDLKKKLENEKVSKERFQDDLSSTMEKLNEATEQIRQLDNQNKVLRAEIDEKIKEVREMEKKKQSTVSNSSSRGKLEGKSTDRALAAQLYHSQKQVKLLKSTMEQFLRMGLFNDDFNLTSPTTSIDTVVAEFKNGRSKQRRNPASSNANKSSTTVASSCSTKTNSTCATENDEHSSEVNAKSHKPLDSLQVAESSDKNKKSQTLEKTQPESEKNCTTAELDIQLRDLMREKEILQAEYSKAPSSGGNAIVRRRREELESRLDTVDSQMCRIKLKIRSRSIV